MMRWVYCLISMWYLSIPCQAFSRDACYPPDVTGIIQSTTRNSITVYDDYEHDNKQFFYTPGDSSLHKGQLVRVYYRCQPFHIVKMSTPVYDPHHRNLGYIIK